MPVSKIVVFMTFNGSVGWLNIKPIFFTSIKSISMLRLKFILKTRIFKAYARAENCYQINRNYNTNQCKWNSAVNVNVV